MLEPKLASSNIVSAKFLSKAYNIWKMANFSTNVSKQMYQNEGYSVAYCQPDNNSGLN